MDVPTRGARSGVASLLAASLALSLAGCPDRKDPGAAVVDASPDDAGSRPASSGPVVAIPIPSASVAAALGADRLPAYDGPTGSLEGTIFVKGEPAPDVQADFSKCPAGAKVYGKLFREGPPGDGGARALADALVGVTGYKGYYLAEKREMKAVTLSDCALGQRTIDLTYGQRLDVANKSSAMFAPALSGFNTPALMVAPPNGDPVHLYAPKPGYYTLSDRFEGMYLKTDVYVLLHPLHAVSDVAGHYRIDGIPAKTKLTVFARLATIGEASAEIEVLPGVVAKADLTLTYATPKDAGAGKPKDAGSYVPPR